MGGWADSHDPSDADPLDPQHLPQSGQYVSPANAADALQPIYTFRVPGKSQGKEVNYHIFIFQATLSEHSQALTVVAWDPLHQPHNRRGNAANGWKTVCDIPQAFQSLYFNCHDQCHPLLTHEGLLWFHESGVILHGNNKRSRQLLAGHVSDLLPNEVLALTPELQEADPIKLTSISFSMQNSLHWNGRQLHFSTQAAVQRKEGTASTPPPPSGAQASTSAPRGRAEASRIPVSEIVIPSLFEDFMLPAPGSSPAVWLRHILSILPQTRDRLDTLTQSVSRLPPHAAQAASLRELTSMGFILDSIEAAHPQAPFPPGTMELDIAEQSGESVEMAEDDMQN